jgi:hypothetical protein
VGKGNEVVTEQIFLESLNDINSAFPKNNKTTAL